MKSWTILLSTLCLFSCNQQENKFEKYVDPLIGTDIRIVQGKDKNSTEERGQIMPAVGVPHGMTNWVAQTQATEQKCHPPYYYFQDAIQGFRASHWMNGSCTQDYGSVTIMPLSNKLEIDPVKRASTFDHTQETATPSYYSVDLNDYDIHAELTGLSRAGIMQFCFEQDGDHYIVIEPNSDEGVAFVEINPEKKEITGYNPVHRIYQGYGKEAGFSGHFVIQLNEEIADYGVWDITTIIPGRKSAKGQKHAVGAWIKLASDKPGKILVKVATSFTSIDNARKNLAAEIPGWNFNEVRQASSDIWNQALGQIAVKGNNEKEKVKFYSALYNAHFLPRTFSDVDGSYPRFDGDGQIMKMDHGTYYCDFSQWDTYRAVHPLFSILTPSRNGDMAHSLVLKGQQGGWLPIFPSWNSYTAAMIGDHCIAMIGDAIVKDTPGFDYEEAYTLMRKNAFEANPDSGSYRDGKGRRAMESYLKYNYVPLEDQVTEAFHRREQVSRTLEYAYDDFVLAQVAKKLGKTDDYKALIKRAENYRNVIDPETGYARGRHADGTWIEPFDPFASTSFICEGTPYHYTWYAPQDIAGLIRHMGGKERFINRLDNFFEGNYYWHGNEPGHHIAYLFAYAGEPWKTQKWVHDIINREYFTTPDGLSGNDDAGQMSSWLVFSMVGFYPVCPGMPYYVIGSPSFEESVITLENGKKFTIEAKGASEKNIYIQSATLNGQPYDKSYILHKDIMNGGILSFVMGDSPNKEWASSAGSLPPSMGL
ncbi:GH92 family glycosyl hydrolase [Parabacteroides merdae]|nr:GH92 family glycosyl hydrolase [Parabacteroides merdae]MDB8967968.1 GH92 family glycosyl hydrolase [Parabacteroides merdae]MDB8971693.1 GH92 family glycosyl hydrolase [Parabacteroides merdae]MDB8975242.1 GH92 family glycosyl hydrolase [Parabacteroides merdae]MDB8978845.1 GH92 family glycosyl hydrolase [Parabacteroides merdae]